MLRHGASAGRGRAHLAGPDAGDLADPGSGRARRTRRAAVGSAQDRHDQPAGRVSADQRRPLQRKRRRHRVLRACDGAQRRRMARRHQQRRRPDLSERAVRDELALQEGAERREVRANAVRRTRLPAVPPSRRAIRACPSRPINVEVAGYWNDLFHEDLWDRRSGLLVGDYTGLPLNEAGKLASASWEPGWFAIPEEQCRPHTGIYGPRGPSNIHVAKVVNPETQAVVALRHLPRDQRAHHLHGRPPASARVRAAPVLRLLHRTVGRARAEVHDHAQQGGVSPAQRHAAQRPGGRDRVVHPPGRHAAADLAHRRSRLHVRGLDADDELEARSDAAAAGAGR